MQGRKSSGIKYDLTAEKYGRQGGKENLWVKSI